MAETEEERNVMTYVLAGIGLGALIGAACALLFAPKPGAELREDISHKLEDLRSKVGELSKDVTTKINQGADYVRSKMHKGQQDAEVALEAGANES